MLSMLELRDSEGLAVEAREDSPELDVEAEPDWAAFIEAA